ncbi:MAG: TatD family hydrolase [Luteimonas sp.]
MHLVDSHCHLDAGEFDGDRADVVQRALAAGVRRIVVPAIAAEGWAKLREVCAQNSGTLPAYGLHPIALPMHRREHLPLLGDWIERERPVAIGECGLDFFIPELDAAEQRLYFEGQLQLARDFDLPVIVHARRAVEAVIVAIRRIGGLRGVVHSFAGSPEQARQLWDAGFLIGLGGPVTYERANRLRRLASTMPLEFLLLETDAPDQPDSDHRGRRNEPARLVTVARTIAGLREAAVEDIAFATAANAERLFRLRGDALRATT